MFHKIKKVYPLADYKLTVQFAEGVTKMYDLTSLFDKYPMFHMPETIFAEVTVDVGGFGIIWNDDLDLSCNELWNNGTVVETPFDGLIAMSDATEMWGLNESTLRKAISYGKLIEGLDAQKFGKQWVVSEESMLREYGKPKDAPADVTTDLSD